MGGWRGGKVICKGVQGKASNREGLTGYQEGDMLE